MIITTKIIDLNDEDLVGEGGSQSVFQHPGDAGKLIKVLKVQHGDDPKVNFVRATRVMRARYGYLRHWYREMEEYLACVYRVGGIPDFVPMQYGLLQTSRGVGFVVEKVAAANGELAPTIHAHCARNGFGDREMRMLDRLFEKLDQSNLGVNDLNTQNIVLSPDGDYLIVVDGVGEGPLINLRRWFGRLRKAKNQRLRNNLIRKLRSISP